MLIVHDNEKETKFLKSRSKYGVSHDIQFTVYCDKLAFDVDGTYDFHLRYGCGGSQHISTIKHMILPYPLVSDTLYTYKKTINGQILYFLEYLRHLLCIYLFTGHST